MAFGLPTRASLLVAAACATLALQTTVVDAWLAPLVTKGNKLFDSVTGAEFRMKGMAYYPRPNGGEFAGVNGYDWTTDDHESVWAPHLKIMKDLGINTVRLYAVNPSKSHDKFMCAASEAGIYVLVGMAAPCPGCAVPEYAPPKCYPDELFTRVQLIYNAFAVYDNTLAFSVGNENNMPTGSDKTGMVTAPCVKALLRDTKAYAAGCASSLRHVPIGLDQADLLPRQQWISYYDCIVDDDANTSADWLGFNPYVECDPIKTTSYAQAMGLQKLMSEYKLANYTQPLMFGEFGCNKGKNTIDGFENQRAFNDAKWMNEEKQMTDEVVGGNVFEFTTEIANLAGAKKLSGASDAGKYGVGYFQPDDCDHDKTPCVFKPYPEYENLKKAYTTTAKSSVTLSTYTPARDRVLSCPAKISTQLPKTPTVETLMCASAQPVCGTAKSNAGKKTRVVDRRVNADGKPLKVVEDVVASPTSGSGSNGPHNVVTAKPTTKPNGDAATSPSSPGAPAPASSSASSSSLVASTFATVLTSVAVAVLAVSTVVAGRVSDSRRGIVLAHGEAFAEHAFPPHPPPPSSQFVKELVSLTTSDNPQGPTASLKPPKDETQPQTHLPIHLGSSTLFLHLIFHLQVSSRAPLLQASPSAMRLPSACTALASVLATSSLLCSSSSTADAAPIVAKGNKFFNSATGEEFRIKGMAYYPRPNAGKMASVGNYDWVTDEYEAVWAPHLEIMKDLGVNTIRLYSVDPSKSHDKFMCACAEAGIYVLVGMTAPCENCSVIDLLPPKCYAPELFSRIQMVYNAMAVYENTLGFSVGNENNLQITHGKEGTATAPCVKALLRDARQYAANCASQTLRQVPIGLDIADIPPRDQWLQYFDCVVDGDENTRADWLGFNPYVECNPLEHTTYSKSVGLQQLMKVYEKVAYSRPLMFGEFGCNEGENTIDGYENQRGFYDAKWMNDEAEMAAQIVGGNVFEFTTETANLVNDKKLTKSKDPGKFGVGYFQPDDCDHDAIPCEFTPYPEYENLKKAFTTTKKSTLTLDAYTPTRSSKPLACPKTIVTKLPPQPKVEILECSVIKPVCSASSNSTIKRAKPNLNRNKSNATKDDDGKKDDKNADDDAEAGSLATSTKSASPSTMRGGGDSAAWIVGVLVGGLLAWV